MVEKKIVIEDEVWREMWKHYGEKWQEHVHLLIEKGLFGTNLVYWAKRKAKRQNQSLT